MADVEIIARVERRRKWTAQEKAALLAEVEAEGGKVTVVARRHRISESVLYNWRAAWKAAASGDARPRATAFMPLGVLAKRASRHSSRRCGTAAVAARGEGKAGAIEIVLPNGARRQRRCLREREGAVAGPARDEGCDMISLAPGTKVFLACSRSIYVPGSTAWRRRSSR